jgi:hypothetical protein
MIWVLPGALAITLPLELTVAMRLFLLLHFTFFEVPYLCGEGYTGYG